MQYYNVILLQYQQVISIPDSPKDIAYKQCVNILKDSKSPISLEELVKMASQRSEQVKHYLGDEFKTNKNWKLRTLYDMLLNHGNIVLVKEKPAVLQWVERNSKRGM